jgi:inorganic pyrophosphatase
MLKQLPSRAMKALSQAQQRSFSSSKTWISEANQTAYTSRHVENNDDRMRHFLQQHNMPLSPWHDIAMQPDGADPDVFNVVIEITRGTTAKYEVETGLEWNPVVQDQKKDKKTGELKLRHYGIPPVFNYGCIPRTWENSQVKDRVTDCFGDNDPLDVVDLTNRDMPMYTLPKLKIIGCACLIDQEELDWKLFGVEEQWAKEFGITSMAKFEQHFPGAVKEVMEWFRVIKTYDGKPANRFAYDDKVLSSDHTLEIIQENH